MRKYGDKIGGIIVSPHSAFLLVVSTYLNIVIRCGYPLRNMFKEIRVKNNFFSKEQTDVFADFVVHKKLIEFYNYSCLNLFNNN